MTPVVKVSHSKPQPPDVVDIRMNRTTAEILLMVLENIGGSVSGPRGVMDSLDRALEDAGIKPTKKVHVTGVLDIEEK